MPQMDFFPQRPEVHPMIYAYRDLNPDYDGLLKVGYTEKDVDRRVAQQYPTKRPDGKLPYEILYRSSAMREDGSCFTDHDVHRMLRRRKITGVGGEWFRCTVDELEAAVLAVKTDTLNEENRTRTFSMRPEQEEAVNKTIAYFRSAKLDTPDRAPKFLWNAKMRFGKTFAAYELFYPQLGVKLCSMAGGGVQKIYMVFLREPSRQDRSGSDLFHLRDGFEIKMNFDRNVSCFIFVNAFMHDDFFD